jgi:uncharacterized protein YehS (DUF1456 family)
MKRDYYRELDEIRNDVISDIKYLLRNNNNEIKIPFYYDYKADTQDIIEYWGEDEEFDFREGDPYNNLAIKVEDEYSRCGDDTSFEIEVLKVYLNNVGQIVLLAKNSMSNIDDVEDMRELIRLYEKLYEIVNK